MYYGFIYKTTNTVNGKIYIGQQKYNQNRKRNEYLGSGVLIKKSVKKYGKKSFGKEILCYCNTLFELNEKEIYYIDLYRKQGFHMYNLANGGFGTSGLTGEKHHYFGKKFSDEHRRKIGDAQRGEKNPRFGTKLSEEHKKIIGEANRNKIVSEKTRAKMSVANKGEKCYFYGKSIWEGKRHSKETKEKISKKKKGVHIHTEASKKKLSKASSGKNNHWFGKFGKDHPSFGHQSPMKGKHISQAIKDKISKSIRGKNHHFYGKGYLFTGNKNHFYGKKHSLESVKKMSIGRTGEKNHMFGRIGKDHPLSISILQINKNTNQTIKQWDSMQDAKRALNIRHISEACNGHAKTAGGFIWKYAS